MEYRNAKVKWSYAARVPMQRLGKMIRVWAKVDALRLLCVVWSEELCVEFCARLLGIDQPRVSRGFGELYRVGLVRRRREGKYVFYQRRVGRLHPVYGHFVTMTKMLAGRTMQVEWDRGAMARARSRQGECWRRVAGLPWPREDKRRSEGRGSVGGVEPGVSRPFRT